MKIGRLAASMIAVAAILTLGGAFAALVATGAILASEPTPTSTSDPAVDPSSSTFQLPEPPAKAQEDVAPPTRLTVGNRAAQEAPKPQGTVYTWEDGDRTLSVELQDDLTVQSTADNAPDDVVVVRGISKSIVRKQAKHGEDSLPVFRSQSGGGLMTLPGGVLLALDPEWDADAVEGFFARNDIPADRRSELDFIPNGFLVETEPGLASLELANALAVQNGVDIASPNWWWEAEAK